MESKDIIINLSMPYADALKKLEQYRAAIDKLAHANKELQSKLKGGALTLQEYHRQMSQNQAGAAQLNSAMHLLESQLNSQIQTENAYIATLNDTRRQIESLTAAYTGLTDAQRDSAAGSQLLAQIQTLRSELGQTAAALDSFQQSVGSYQSAVGQAGSDNGSFVESLLGMVDSGQQVGGLVSSLAGNFKNFGGLASAAFTTLGTAIGNVTKILIANPIIAILSAIVGVFMLLKAALNSSEEATARFNAILAPLRMIIDGIMSVLQALVGVILTVVENVMGMAMAFARLLEVIPGLGKYIKQFNDAMQQSVEISKEEAELEKLKRNAFVQSAEERKKLAELQQKLNDKEALTAQERMKIAEEYNKIEKEAADRKVELAQREFEVVKKKLETDKENKALLDELAKREAAYTDALTDRINKTAECTNLIKGINQEMTDEARKADDEEKARQKEAADRARKAAEAAKARKKEQLAAQKQALEKEAELYKQVEDGRLALEAEGFDKSIAQTKQASGRTIDQLKKRLAEEENLTATSRQHINELIELEEQKLNANVEKLRKEDAHKRFEQEVERQRQEIAIRLELAKEGSAEELDLRIRQIEATRQEALRQAEKTGADTTLIHAKYDQEIANEQLKVEKAAMQKMVDEDALAWQLRMSRAKVRAESEIAVKLAMKQQELEQLAQYEDESDAAYLMRKQLLADELTMLNQSLSEEKKRIEEEAWQAEWRNLEAFGTMTTAMSEFIDEFAGQSEAMAAFSKSLALFEIGLNTAKAISAGIAAAQTTGPFPANIIAIATTITAVLTNMTKAKQLLSKSKEPSFAQGGLVSGPGTPTSDSLTARLSNGESILTARATEMFSPLLSAFNQIGGGVPIQVVATSATVYAEEMLARAFARGVAMLPAPRVGVDEISTVQRRVEVLEAETLL